MKKSMKTLITHITTGMLTVVAFFVFTGCSVEGTTTPPGNINAFRPVALYRQIAGHAGPKARLMQMRASGVNSNGTIDLDSDFHPRIEYRFLIKPTADEVKQLPKRRSGLPWEWATAEIDVHRPSWVRVTTSNFEGSLKDHGMKRSLSGQTKKPDDEELLPDPTCSFADLWGQAAKKGAPPAAVADIEYSKHGYEFTIHDIQFEVWFNQSCQIQSFAGRSERLRNATHTTF